MVLWYISTDPKLPDSIKSKIDNIENDCFVSIVSFWEIAIKQSLGKLDLKTSLADLFRIIKSSDIQPVPLEESHILRSAILEFHHQDPFD